MMWIIHCLEGQFQHFDFTDDLDFLIYCVLRTWTCLESMRYSFCYNIVRNKNVTSY